MLCLYLSFAACGNTEADAEVIPTPTATADASAEPAPTAPESRETATAAETQAVPTLSATPKPTLKPASTVSAAPKAPPKPTLKPAATPKVTAEPIPTAAITPTPTEAAITLDQYIEGIQDEIDQMTAALAEQGINMKIKVRGNSLVYSYQYTEDLPDLEAVKATLEESLDSVSSTFKVLLQQMKTEIPSAESIIVEYLAKDGTEIYSKEFK